MARIGSEHFNPRGKPKRGFGTKAEAKEFMNEHNIPGKEAYYCHTCHKFHIGERISPAQKKTKKNSTQACLDRINKILS